MKRLLVVLSLVVLLVVSMVSCNTYVCPAYADSEVEQAEKNS